MAGWLSKLFIPVVVLFFFIPGVLYSKEAKEIKLPEIVIKGIYQPTYKDIEGVRLSLDIVSPKKAEPSRDVYGIGRELFERLEREEATPKSPGCAYRHGVTSFFAKAFKGSEAYYKRGSYFYRKGEYKKALSNFKTVTSEFPEGKFTAPALYWQGECLFHLGKEENALLLWKEDCLHHKGELVDYACYSAGWLLLKYKKFEDSLIPFERVRRFFPESPVFPESLLLEAVALYRLGKLERSLFLLESNLTSLKSSPVLPKVHFAIGIMSMDIGNFTKAEEHFSLCLRSTMDKGLVYNSLVNRGFSRMETGKVELSLADFLDSLEVAEEKSKKAISTYGIMLCYLKLKRFNTALKYLEDLRATKLYDLSVRVVARELAASGRVEDALAVMNRLKGKYTGEDYFFLGSLYYRMGNFARALGCYRLALENHFDRNKVLYNMGLTFYRLGNFTEALKTLSSVEGSLKDRAILWIVKISLEMARIKDAEKLVSTIRSISFMLQASSMVGEKLIEKGLWEEAIRFLSPCKKFIKTNPYPTYLLCEALFNAGKYRECESILLELKSSEGISTERWCGLYVKTLLEEGKRTEAFKAVDTCLREKGDSPLLNYLKGEVLYRMGDYQKAPTFYRKAVELGLSYPEKLDAYLKMYSSFVNQGEKAKALSMLLEAEPKVMKEAPELYPKLFYQIITYYYESGEWDYFVERAKRFLKEFGEDPLSVAVRIMLGDYYLSLGLTDMAENMYKPILQSRIRPERFSLFLSLANSYSGKDFHKSFEYYNMALSSSNRSIKEEALYGLIVLLYRNGKFKEAIDRCVKFESLFPSSHKVYEVKSIHGMSLVKLGRTDQGVFILNDLLKTGNTPKDVAIKSLKFIVHTYAKTNRNLALSYIDKLITLLEGPEKARYHLLKCELSMDPSECVRVSYLYSEKDVVSKALLFAAEFYSKKGDINSVKKVLKRAEKVGTKEDVGKIKDLLKKLERSGGKR